jgi:hypothetical protein
MEAKMFSEEKVEAIRKYLRVEFADYDLADEFDFERHAQTFRLIKDSRICLITVSGSFINDHTTSELSRVLSYGNLKQYFADEKVSRIIITEGKIQIERCPD